MNLTPAQKRFIKKVESGFCHSLPVEGLDGRSLRMVVTLVRANVLKHLMPRGRFPERLVLSSKGSHTFGTFRVVEKL